jgi:hypothetical protein
MSALGQKQFANVWLMSALPPKADIAALQLDVRFVPKADILRCSKSVVIRSPRRREIAVIVALTCRAPSRS